MSCPGRRAALQVRRGCGPCRHLRARHSKSPRAAAAAACDAPRVNPHRACGPPPPKLWGPTRGSGNFQPTLAMVISTACVVSLNLRETSSCPGVYLPHFIPLMSSMPCRADLFALAADSPAPLKKTSSAGSIHGKRSPHLASPGGGANTPTCTRSPTDPQVAIWACNMTLRQPRRRACRRWAAA